MNHSFLKCNWMYCTWEFILSKESFVLCNMSCTPLSVQSTWQWLRNIETLLQNKYLKYFVGWFYLSVILLISIATITTAIIIMIQKKGYYGHAVPKVMRKIFFYYIAWLVRMKMPTGLGGYNRKWSLCNDKVKINYIIDW